MVWTFKIDEINEVAKACLKEIGDSRVIAFHGEMGAGKTTFIHALCDVLGVKDVVGSPTFSIINEYLFNDNGRPGKIYHIDLYRVKDEEEAIQAGVEDCLYSDHISFVEWPEKAISIFPQSTVHLYLTAINTQTRTLRIGNN